MDLLGTGLLDFYDTIGLQLKASFPTLALNAIIPFWYSGKHTTTTGGSKSILNSLLERVEWITCMDYNDDPDRIKNQAEDTILAANGYNTGGSVARRVLIAVEAGCSDNNEPLADTTTFCGQPASELEAGVAPTEAAYNDDSSFAGLTLHDWGSYSDLSPPPIAAGSGPSRALFVWSSSVVKDPAQLSSMIAFATARRVGRVLVHFGNFVNDRSKWLALRQVILDCSAAGLAVQLLFGKHEWATNTTEPA